MSPRRVIVTFLVLLIVVVATVFVKWHLQSLASLDSTPVEAVLTNETPEIRLDDAKRDLEHMRLELESADFTEANISDTKARISEVQSRLDGLETETAEADPNSESFRFQIQQQQIELQGDLENQIAELDTSIADLTRRGMGEEQIANLRAARDLVASRIQALQSDLQLRQMTANRAQAEGSPAVADERSALEKRLSDLRQELETWERQESENTNERLKALKEKIVQQEILVRNLEMEAGESQTR